MRILSRVIHALPVAAMVVAGACATTAPAGDPIARLQVRRDAQPRAAAVHRSLGIALYKAGRLPEARVALGEAMRLDPRDGTTALYLGLTAEKQNDLAAARDAYITYLQHGRTRGVRATLENRLAAIQRRQLEADARSAVANEASMGRGVSPRVIAVMPFRFAGADTTLRPLGRGFAELVTTDLARSSALTVVERARMQALLDEMALSRTAGDTAHALRAGRMVQAGRIVQGGLLQMGSQRLRADAAIVDVPSTRAVGGATADDDLEALFDLEKRLVLQLFTDLGVTLTAAERRDIEQRPTRSLAAFLSYSRGLMAEDAGDFPGASRFYQDALRIDPGFGAAAQRNGSASRTSAGAQVTPAAVEAAVAGTPEGQVAAAAVQGNVVTAASTASAATTLATVVNDVNTTQAGAAAGSTVTVAGSTISTAPMRDPAAEGTGNDSPTTRSAKIVIIIPIPNHGKAARP